MAESINRRSFIKGAGLTVIGSALLSRDLLAEPGQGASGTKTSSRLRNGSSNSFHETVTSVSGIPLGGIGAGSVEIRPDGYFADWLIFNMGGWSPSQPEHEHGPSPDMGDDGLQFFVRCAQKGKTPQLRRLGMREDQNDLYSLAYAMPVQGIEFDGKFPFATLNYIDETLPVTVTGLAFAPIIPHDARTSATPGFTVAFKVKNTSSTSVDVSLMGTLRNPLATGAPDRALTKSVFKSQEKTTVSMTTTATEGRKSVHGSMAFSVTGGKASSIAGGYRWYLGNGGWGGSRGYGTAHFSYLHAYYRDGNLPSLECSKSLDDVLEGFTDVQIEAMSQGELFAAADRLYTDSFFKEFFDRVKLIQEEQFKSQAGMVNLMKECRDRLNHFSGNDRKRSSWGGVALESSIQLAPGEEREIRFALSWFFPNHFSQIGPNLGHQYEHWFENAYTVNQFLVKNHSEHRKQTVNFAEAMLSTNIDPKVSFAWGAQLTTLIKSSWWCKDGRFAIWEGLGCCGLHTTDITYQGSFPIIALFPELQLRQINMGASYQRADGRIPHFFSPDLLHVDNGFDRVDMNPQYVMMVCRDYLWTGDKQFAQNNWANVVRAMASTQALDGDGDGIPERDTRRNTYDQWDLEGSPSYICGLWLGALRSAIRLAHDLGYSTEEAEWKTLLAKASNSFIGRLWNGEYFNLWVSETGKDECCMSDQLSGEWYTGLMGLGHSVPLKNLHGAVDAVYRHNFDFEHGLRNATYPAGRKPHFRTHQSFQAVGNWTGIEYANAALMIELGRVEEGLEVMRSVHQRYVRSGRRWNHAECGDHYFRAMSSWTTLLALTGLRLDVPNQSLTVGPKIDNLVAPWFTPTGYGVMAKRGSKIEIDCRSGSLSFKELRLPAASKSSRFSIGGQAVKAKIVSTSDGLIATFAKSVSVKEGKSMMVSIE
jgi:uncharacterized protein (DUF608 family)